MRRTGGSLEAEHSHRPDGLPRPGEAHLWIHRPGMEPGQAGALTKDELGRASRYRSRMAQQRFLTRRRALRSLLGWYLGMAPEAVPLQVDARGKPFVPSGAELRFNAGEADGLIALAFRVHAEVGIDVETIRRGKSVERLAATFLTSGEMAELERVETADRRGALIQAWTRKEAYLKGVGVGLRSSPKRIDTGLQGQWRPVRDSASSSPSPWWVTDLEPLEGARLALATEGTRPRLRVFSEYFECVG